MNAAALATLDPPAAILAATPTWSAPRVGPDLPPPAIWTPQPTTGAPGAAPSDADMLKLWAEAFHDAQQSRIALGNRLHAASVDPDQVSALLDGMDSVEKALRRKMIRTFRSAFPELARWAKDTPGIGEHTIARLCGAVGDPCIARPHHWDGTGKERTLVADPPYWRTVSQLWAYCGVGDPTRKPRKGMTAEDAFALGNPRAKVIIHMAAESAMKCAGSETRARSPFRDTYDLGRLHYGESHPEWTKGHNHNAALRLVKKAILREVWCVQREVHAR